MKTLIALGAAACALCAVQGAQAELPRAATATAAPSGWFEALPHGGDLGELAGWWSRFDDPLLVQLVERAQAASPDLASALSRIAQARATAVGAGAALLPNVEAGVSGARGRSEPGFPVGNTLSASMQMAWELDLFGGNRAGARAAAARLSSATAGWHEARVAVAAEVATQYVSLRACEARRIQAEVDAGSRAETDRLTQLSLQHGMQSPGTAALARASAAQGRAQLAQAAAECDTLVKRLVALTAAEEPALRAELAASGASVPQAPRFGIDAVPARALAQRPDLHAAALNVQAAAGDADQARASRWPRVMLKGSVGRGRAETPFGTQDGSVWSFGPLSVVLPVFDAGVRRANLDAARSRYDEAVAQYGGRLRTAVREVEEALVTLQAATRRSDDLRVAAEGFRTSFASAQARYRGGLASLFELEEARRSDVQAQVAMVDLEQQRTQAWIQLYRALGGGWGSPAPTTTISKESTP
ncbi:efflux transporter outer membrane subunit [Ramlibacter henchirensis]|uniref:Efflux transporter outer membrane subunit n=1 Tax=Ramlibacter henchirensis TaxID=204072 RepID=A0A4Z0C4U7_9BURK|nr:efflux transporter outer membrane subunit [Ramlibacter henchirensis]TFZ05964.1 efflux transporter outer membrane subunit [Ramlibacter henchirensis]